MNIFLEEKDIPKCCMDCHFVNGEDECILQDEDANFAASESWDDLYQGCPLIPLKIKRKPTNVETSISALKNIVDEALDVAFKSMVCNGCSTDAEKQMVAMWFEVFKKHGIKAQTCCEIMVELGKTGQPKKEEEKK